MITPDDKISSRLRTEGFEFIAGVDEVGRGALAGPVVAAAVVLPEGHGLPVRDSKTLSERQRENLYAEIQITATSIGVGIVDASVIDEIGIVPSTVRAMMKAIGGLETLDHLLIDAMTLAGIKTPQTAIVKGDQKESCIAAASIIAKVTRDRMMINMHETYPMYNFRKNKGYGTKDHREVILSVGSTPIHRLSFTVKS